MIYFQFLQRRRRLRVYTYAEGKHVVVVRCARLFVVYCHKKNTEVYKREKLEETAKSSSLRCDSLHSICGVISPVGRVADNIFPIFNLSLVNSFRIYDDSWPHFFSPNPPFPARDPFAPAISDNTFCPNSHSMVHYHSIKKSSLFLSLNNKKFSLPKITYFVEEFDRFSSSLFKKWLNIERPKVKREMNKWHDVSRERNAITAHWRKRNRLVLIRCEFSFSIKSRWMSASVSRLPLSA